MVFSRSFFFTIILITVFSEWTGTAILSSAMANEIYSTGQRCNNKKDAGQEFSQDNYVYFDTNSSRIREQERTKIEHILIIANGHQAQQICLFGKASKIGDALANKVLGRERALSVARDFEQLGWPHSRIIIGTEGEAWGWLQDTLTSDSKDDRRVLIRLSQ